MIRIRPSSRALAAATLALASLASTASSRARAAEPEATPAPVAPPPLDPSTDPMLARPPPAPRTVASWDEALRLIRAQSPDYLSSAEAVRRAAAQREIALAAVLPTVQAQGAYVHQLLSPLSATLAGLIGPATSPNSIVPFPVVTPPENTFLVGGTVSWSVLNPRGIYGIGTADRNVAAEQLNFEDRRRQIAAAVVDAMLATLAAERVAELNRVGLRASLDRLKLTRARLEYGQGTELDVDRAQQDVAASRSAVLTGDESLRRSREALGALLGSTVAMAPPEGSDLESFETAVAKTCHLNDDIERRPDVAAARKRVEVAQRAVTDADLLFAPSVGLSSQLQYSSEPVIAPNTTWSVGGVVTLPLYDGGARYGARKDAVAALEQARQALVAKRLAAIVASAQARRAVSVFGHERDVAREQRDLAARIDARTRDGYSKGLGTSLDLVISAQALRQAEIDLAILEFQVDDARANAVLVDAECAY
jgi:outer membrane protein TolC